MFSPRFASGFTIVQLIVIVLLLGVLAAVAIPRALNGAVDEPKQNFVALASQLVSRVDQLALAEARPEHLGDEGNPNTMAFFFAGVLEEPVPNTGYGAENSGAGWKSMDGWLPAADRYYYFFDGDGNGQYSSVTDSRIYYDSATGEIVQDAWGAGAI